jgi:hypothetical protein
MLAACKRKQPVEVSSIRLTQRSNAKATIDVKSSPQGGVRVTIFFVRANAAPRSE